MVSVTTATEIILKNLHKPKVGSVDLQDAVGKVLAEEITADRDFPPFDRVAMDGIAIEFASWKEGHSQFRITDVQAAGDPQKHLLHADTCLEVMTGAMLPVGADTVIRYEDIEIKEGVATVIIADVQAGQHIHRQAQDAKKESVLLRPHQVLSAAEVALLASVGKEKVAVFLFPRTAVVASGDELVAVNENPAPYQIRRSNSYALQAAMKALGGEAASFHLIDKKDVLLTSLRTLIDAHDLIVLSGGVSKGKFDFIPEVLEELGIQKLFHQVTQRPGKPFWFGVSDTGKVVFALPGNPVSTYMCFYRYIKPWLLKSMGLDVQHVSAILANDFIFQPRLTYFLQVSVMNEGGKLMAYPDAGGGSGDLANLKNVDGFLELPEDRSAFKSGEFFPFISFRSL
jgi:molybdopterin molybdotransferase